MQVQTVEESPVNRRGGQESFLLLTDGQFGSANFSITWVDCAPGSRQQDHVHDANEQVYIILRGSGLMRVGAEEREVGPGTLIFIPPGTAHSILNTSAEVLTYVSATAPPFDLDSLGSSQRYRTQK
jgi:mannose-6-phosphate isomerase-like protein (cupin superfamily)